MASDAKLATLVLATYKYFVDYFHFHVLLTVTFLVLNVCLIFYTLKIVYTFSQSGSASVAILQQKVVAGRK